MTSWVLTCYGQLELDAEYDTFDRALTAAAHHIRSSCPHGPMPWATTITWHQTTLPDLGGRYVACGGGSWLNHHLVPVRWLPPLTICPAPEGLTADLQTGHTMTKIDPTSPPPSVLGRGDTGAGAPS